MTEAVPSDGVPPKPDPGRLCFRGLRGESDYPLILAINLDSRRANGDDMVVSLEDIAGVFTPSERFDPARHVLIASLGSDPDAAVGYSRVGWYSSNQDTQLYFQISFLRRAYRRRGVWEAMVRQNEQRLREFAEGHPPGPQRFFQAWASDHERDWMATLEACGYVVVRRFHNMVRGLDDIPDRPLPPGLEVRPVTAAAMRRVWEAQKEMNAGLFENVAEEWLEETYPAWLADRSHTPHLWQVAWDGDRLAGMVLTRIDAEADASRERRRGYTEHIYVRPPWRRRGVASALIARSLRVLREQGMAEAELGVDAENESAAFRLYEGLGYRTYSVDTWYRKPMASP